MMLRPILAALALTLLAAPVFAAPATVKVSLETSEGTIIVAVDQRRAPITAANFLAYVDKKKFDNSFFYRAARAKGGAPVGFVQGGIRNNPIRTLPRIAHEPTSKTGLRHLDGSLSMARNEPGSATGDFFIVVGPQPSMDAHPGAPGDNAGYAVFGKVVSGMPVVKRILKAKTWPGGAAAMKGQLIEKPIRIIAAKRIS